MAIWADDQGVPYYPTRGSPLEDIQTGINWEVSNRNSSNWINAWYGTVNSWDPTLDRDLKVATMLDVGRDGVPVVAAVDTFDLPNWQNGASTPHTRHAVTIVGYDNTADPDLHLHRYLRPNLQCARRQPERPDPRHRPVGDGGGHPGRGWYRVLLVGQGRPVHPVRRTQRVEPADGPFSYSVHSATFRPCGIE